MDSILLHQRIFDSDDLILIDAMLSDVVIVERLLRDTDVATTYLSEHRRDGREDARRAVVLEKYDVAVSRLRFHLTCFL
jgi:hypothetical protein